MTWLRAQRRFGSWLALLALALQLSLAFGHVHAEATNPAPAMLATDPGGKADPSQSDSDDRHDAHYCAIYAVLTLLSSAQIAAAPVVPLPAAVIGADAAFTVEAASVTSTRTAFRSRAPPIS